jgi:membrane dipeptidase
MPSDLTAIPGSGLDAFILDVSSVAQIQTDDGSIRYYRSFEACAQSMTAMRRALREDIPQAFLATKGTEIRSAAETGQTAVFFQMQGCEPLGEEVSRLDLFYELGLRVQQLTHHNDNPFAGGALEEVQSGLTELGRDGVMHMNELGILPDVSHGSDPTALDVCRVSSGPVILSHGAARAIVPNARCAPDEVIRAVAETGGVMGIFMMSFWLTRDPVPEIHHLIQQLRHIADVGGMDAVCIANDYPVSGEAQLAELGNDNEAGVEPYLPWWQDQGRRGIPGFEVDPEHVVIPELNDVRRMFTIHDALGDAGFNSDEVEKIMGGNWIRVLTEVLG